MSVILATYNRPDVLACAIRSVLAQDFQDWELIVVGDHCAEPTGTTVAAFADPRIRYFNLALNYGEQSGPNNVGVARARGRYIAFVNHDDMWFPDHLRSAVDWLEASGADLVIGRSAAIVPGEPHGDDWWVVIHGGGRRGRYDPAVTLGPASSLLFKHELAKKIGPWRPAAECHLASSQEWLFRAWKSGAVVRTIPHLTVLQINSGGRPRSYLSGASAEHASFEALLKRPTDLRLQLLERCRIVGPRTRFRRAASPVLAAFLRAVAHLGIPPLEIMARFREGFARGGFINRLRSVRGLAPLPAQEPTPAELRELYLAARSSEERAGTLAATAGATDEQTPRI